MGRLYRGATLLAGYPSAPVPAQLVPYFTGTLQNSVYCIGADCDGLSATPHARARPLVTANPQQASAYRRTLRVSLDLSPRPPIVTDPHYTRTDTLAS